MIKHAVAGALCAFGIVVVACAGGGGEDTEDGNSEECSSDSDCKGDRVCSDGSCVDQPSPNGGSTSSSPPPAECSEVGESCASTGCCTDGNALCVDYGASVGTLCGAKCEYGNECESGCCGGLKDGGGVCSPYDYCEWGVPCTDDDHCNSNVCLGWCSESCSDSNDCASNGWCYELNGGGQYCFPQCETNSDCSIYPGTVCELFETVDGYDIWTCG